MTSARARHASAVGCFAAPTSARLDFEAGLSALGYARELLEPRLFVDWYGGADVWIRAELDARAAARLAEVVAQRSRCRIEQWTATLSAGGSPRIDVRGVELRDGIANPLRAPDLDEDDAVLARMPKRGIEWFPLAVESAPSPVELEARLNARAWIGYRLDLALDRALQQRGLPRPTRDRERPRNWRRAAADGRPHWVGRVREASVRQLERRLPDGRIQLALQWANGRRLTPLIAAHDVDELLRWKDELAIDGLA